MVNGNASLLGVPWETIIKAYRAKPGRKLFPTLAEYRDDFFRFVQSNRKIFPASLQELYGVILIRSFLKHVRDSMQAALDVEAEKRNGLDPPDIPPIIHDVVLKKLKEVRGEPRLRGFGPATLADFRKQFSQHITDVNKELLGNLKIQPKTRRAMAVLVYEVMTRNHFSSLQSEIVFAGYGEDEFLPRLYSTSIEMMLKNKLRAVNQHDTGITPEVGATIVPFAQQEVVHAFMNGIDPKIDAFVRMTSGGLFLGMVNQILDTVENHDATFGKKLRRSVTNSAKSALSKVHADWDKKQQEYWTPIVNIAASLPKDELGAMAEALVNLTKFRRKVSQERETVGGPIDVAVISRGDGFVWVKRKHYFDPKLNPRVLAKFGRGG